MAEITAKLVNQLRELTQAGMMECKKALVEAEGDIEKAKESLRKRGVAKAVKKAARATNEGIVASYIHSNNKVGVLIEVACESDFVAKNELFQEMVKDLTIQIASMAPQYVSREQVPAEVVEKEKSFYREEVANKPANIQDKIIEGKLEKFYSEICLVDQPFVKDDKIKINDLIKGVIAKLGENMVVRRFVRYQVGEEL